MATLAEAYYLKALENYPWELSEVMENLTYALSYDEHNSAANCLMGQLQMNQLKNYTDAEGYFERAISSDPNFASAYENLIVLYIHIGKFKKAQQILDYAQGIPVINRSFILSKMALILEKRGAFKLSKHYLKSALANSICNEERTELQLDLDRVKSKLKKGKKS
jgi:tetratricopeptide (TPR) repeat protein